MSALKVVTPKVVDIVVEDGGSIMLLRPLTDAAKTWLEEGTSAESWQWFGGALAVERRYALAIVQGAMDDGLTVE